MSEPAAKKLVPKWDTLYPTKAELDWLANNEMWDQLEKRIKDKTRENLIADAVARRKVSVEIAKMKKDGWKMIPFNIAYKIALNMDIRTLLTISSKFILFQEFLLDDAFWKEKFAIEFPEVLYVMKQMEYDPEKRKPETGRMEMFKNTLWRRVYYVVRYIMVRYMFSRISTSETATGAKNAPVTFKFDYIKEGDNYKRSVFVKSEFDEQEIQVGDTTLITREEFLNKHIIANRSVTRSSYLLTIFPTAAIVKMIREPDEKVRLQYSDWLTFNEAIDRGYAKRNDNKIIMIGDQVCETCAESATVMEETGRLFCGKQCQKMFYSKK